jgi:hypothetical protein
MKLLDACNGILPVLGEHTVTRVDARHPTLAVILPNIDRALDETLTKGWWFNTAQVKLFPGLDKTIALPNDTLAFLPDADFRGSVRGKKLYNNETVSFTWDGPVTGVLTERVGFEDLPESVASFVFYYALVTTYLTDIGLEPIVEQWREMADSAEELATAEHLRNVRYSTRKSPRYARYRNSLRG